MENRKNRIEDLRCFRLPGCGLGREFGLGRRTNPPRPATGGASRRISNL
ncbi:hypothetical protein IIA15_02965 [candidate division TA06 bacterium]|nr:hypothetical protein [candidate division TA06 bacterium]